LRVLGVNLSVVLGTVVEWTFKTFETLLFFAWLSLIEERVELLLLPAVAEVALLELFASLLVAGDEGAALPVLAKLSVIFK
jgi:hypothetical protein